jgi:hypothetical protein
MVLDEMEWVKSRVAEKPKNSGFEKVDTLLARKR